MKALPHADYEVINDEDVGYAFVSFNKNKKVTKMKHSPFISGASPVKYDVVLRKMKYEINGNLLEIKDEIYSKDIKKEFIPMGVSTLHMVEFKKI